jgi:AbrB family looped-hinge helix DNA binding protein
VVVLLLPVRLPKEAALRITSKGQVTIPQEIRERFGLLPHTEVEFVAQGNVVVIRKTASGNAQAREWVRANRGTLKSGMSTDELMRLTRGED